LYTMMGTTIKPDFEYHRLRGDIAIGTFSSWNVFTELAHFVTLRGKLIPNDPFSSFNLGRHSGEDLTKVLANRTALCQVLGLSPKVLIQPRQVHGQEILPLSKDFFSWEKTRQTAYLSAADGLVTDLPHICVAVSTADCVPLLFYDPHHRVVGASHAGWRGTVKHIAAHTVAVMQERYDSRPEEIYAAIGPSIGEAAFEVGDEVVEAFTEAYPTHTGTIITPRRGERRRHHVNLWEANSIDLLSAGVRPEHITLAGICTYTHNELFYSSRRAGGKLFGRFLSGIFLRS
ncbi:MAG: peptidoglycan editing factor PgeF, partial [Porphyromonadaceae bacterium]|nr:peptidoglycan editing factor PgeF [Porphyromonadaceae bacterium]